LPDGDCLFCRIAAGEADAHVVYSDDDTVAFLDVRPLFPGHTLLIPRAHHETVWDLPPELVEPYFANVRRLSKAVADTMEAQGAFVAMNNIVSQSVPHLHTHLVPRNPKDGLRGFFWPRSKYAEGEAEEVAERLRPALAAA
jgi:histidine triad (HIT) family protein